MGWPRLAQGESRSSVGSDRSDLTSRLVNSVHPHLLWLRRLDPGRLPSSVAHPPAPSLEHSRSRMANMDPGGKRTRVCFLSISTRLHLKSETDHFRLQGCLTPEAFTTLRSSRFVERDRVVDALRQCALGLKIRCPDIVAIHLFGSFSSGAPTPRSDADIAVEIRNLSENTWRFLRLHSTVG